MTKIYLVKHYVAGISKPYAYSAFTNKKKAQDFTELNNIKFRKYGGRAELEELQISTFSLEEELRKLKGAK